MTRRVRAHRLDAQEPAIAPARTSAHPAPWALASRSAAGEHLDLGSRIALAGDLQATVGNAAVAHLVGLVRTDRRKEPPGGVREIGEAAGSPGNRGLTRSTYVANPPIFRIGRTEQVGGTWNVKPAEVRLPSLDYEVFWPAPGRHRVGAYGSGNHLLQVSEDWSNRLLAGENEHVADTDRAWEMTWGRVASAINAMASGAPSTGATADAARDAAWQEFRRRLPEPMRPTGDTPTVEAQEAKWGPDDAATIFRRMMGETRRVRDLSGWHTPDQSLRGMEGADRVDELSDGTSRIPGVETNQVMQDAWDRITRG